MIGEMLNPFAADAFSIVRAGEKLDQETPRERRTLAV